MKMMMVLIMVMAVSVMVSAESLSAQCAWHGGAKAEASEDEVINATCPVMSGDVDKSTPHKALYNGKTLGFCCAGCVDAFNAEPEKYVGIVEEEIGEELGG